MPLSAQEQSFRYNMVKGRVAETLIQELFLSLGYNVFHYGMERSVPGMPDMKQGFTLLPDGSARSEHMATLRYSSWSVHSDTLLLTGESLGNGERFLFTDRLVFSFPHTDTLVLGQQGFLKSFARNN